MIRRKKPKMKSIKTFRQLRWWLPVAIMALFASQDVLSQVQGQLPQAAPGNLANDVIIIPIFEDPPPPPAEKMPLTINWEYDAVIVGTSTEPFNIQAGVNDRSEDSQAQWTRGVAAVVLSRVWFLVPVSEAFRWAE